MRDVRDKHRGQLDSLKKVIRFNRLCELNVIEQALNVAQTSIVRDAWARQQRISIHGWIYAIDNGLLRDLGLAITQSRDATQQYDSAVKRLAAPDMRGL